MTWPLDTWEIIKIGILTWLSTTLDLVEMCRVS